MRVSISGRYKEKINSKISVIKENSTLIDPNKMKTQLKMIKEKFLNMYIKQSLP